MDSNQFAAAVATCSIVQADELSRTGWRAWSDGLLTDSAAERLQAAVESRKQSLRAKASQPSERRSATPRRRPARDHRKSIFRRRRLAASGSMPSKLACHFATAELATLSVIAREIKKQRHNQFEWPLGKIAALAGVSETSARNALHEAHRLELLTITERRRNGRRSLTNRVCITSKLWLAWLRLGPRRGEGAKSFRPRSNRDNLTASAPETTPGATAKPRDRKRRSNFSGRRPISTDRRRR